MPDSFDIAWGFIFGGLILVTTPAIVSAWQRHRRYKANVMQAVTFDASREPQSHVRFVEKRDV